MSAWRRRLNVFLKMIKESSQQVDRLDKSLLDFHIAHLDRQISQSARRDHAQRNVPADRIGTGAASSSWSTARTSARTCSIEVLDVSKDALRQDFEDTPGNHPERPVSAHVHPGIRHAGRPADRLRSSRTTSSTEAPQDIALLRNISKVSAAAHMPFIGSVSPKFFGKESMEEVASIRDIGNYFDRAEYLKWKSFRESDDARYIGLTLPRFLARLPYGPDTTPVRAFNYEEAVKGPDHNRYLWANASFAFAANMVKSFIKNGWCVQIRGPQAGGLVDDLPIHLYDLGTGNQAKIPTEVLIPETREFEFANLGFIPLSYYKNHDFACFFSAHSAQKPAIVRDQGSHGEQSRQRAPAVHLPALAHRALSEADPAREHRHDQGPASA